MTVRLLSFLPAAMDGVDAAAAAARSQSRVTSVLTARRQKRAQPPACVRAHSFQLLTTVTVCGAASKASRGRCGAPGVVQSEV